MPFPEARRPRLNACRAWEQRRCYCHTLVGVTRKPCRGKGKNARKNRAFSSLHSAARLLRLRLRGDRLVGGKYRLALELIERLFELEVVAGTEFEPRRQHLRIDLAH